MGLQQEVWTPVPGDDHCHSSLHCDRVSGILEVWGSCFREHHTKFTSSRYVSNEDVFFSVNSDTSSLVLVFFAFLKCTF